jgi:hypothetical protein
MPQEFVTINFQCDTDGCPNSALGEMHTTLKLTEDGDLPWFICGVCQVDIIPNPNSESADA